MNITYIEYALKQKDDFIESSNSFREKIAGLESSIRNAPHIIMSGRKIEYENKKYDLLYRTITVYISTNIVVSTRLVMYFINVNSEIKILLFLKDTVV